MHTILATLGTDGDVVPHAGLGARLRSRGHEVTLAAPEPFRALAESLGIAFRPLVTAEEFGEMIADPDLFHPLLSGRMMARWGARFIPRNYELLAELTAGAERVLVTNPGVLAARLVQEKLGRPTATLLLQPGMIPSTFAPPEMPGGLTLPQWVPRPLGELYWAGVDTAGYLLVARSLNRVRSAIGLAPVRRLFRWWLSPELVVGLFPEWYAARQPDWPAQLRLAGFGRYDGDRGGELGEDVRAFCRSGSAPIAFTLGTGMTHAARFFRAAAAACELLGARGILLTKYAHQLPARLPPGVRHCAFAPFRKLLPLCGAVVHHGGIGTTAAALSAGVPQLILPLAWDQPDNAARVRRLGVGLSLGPRQRTAGHLARALARLMAPETRDRCRAVANQVGDVDGLDVAADWIERLAARSLTPAANREARAMAPAC
ncbi:MAG TPA: glycosyltransferase [Tepidisphaeraceae bacterium]|jgi:UDP:flavonoid glycosyltransferase YjiC (YdhE family)